MALILALNPGNSHSPTLSRLARELHGCELIGAESCVVAIKAIKERVPDVVLLPAKSARGEADLLAHLKTVQGGVPTLRLPPVEAANPLDLARQIREMLTGTPVRPRASARTATRRLLWARRRTCSRRQPQPSTGFVPGAHSGSKSDRTMPFQSLSRHGPAYPLPSLATCTNPMSPSNSPNPTITTRPTTLTNPLQPCDADQDVAAARGRSRGRHRHRGRPGVLLAPDSRQIQRHGRPGECSKRRLTQR